MYSFSGSLARLTVCSSPLEFSFCHTGGGESVFFVFVGDVLSTESLCNCPSIVKVNLPSDGLVCAVFGEVRSCFWNTRFMLASLW